MHVSPFQFLWFVIALSATARLAFALRQKRQRRTLHALARTWQMHYSPYDRFDLAPRVAERFPVPGAAEFHVVDLIYGSDGDHYRYVFTAEYTTGVMRARHRLRRVVMFREPKNRDTSGADRVELRLAEDSNDVMQQYQSIATWKHDGETLRSESEKG